MKLRLFFMILFLGVTVSLFAQYKVIPFAINKNNRMIIDYNIKGVQGRFFFDTGSNANNLCYEFADKIGLEYDKNKSVPAYSLDKVLMSVHFTQYMDSIFDHATFVEKCSDFVVYDDNLDGLIGIPRTQRGILDIDFRHNQLRLWDSLPISCITKKEVFTLPLVKEVDGFEDNLSKGSSISPAINGYVTIADSILLPVNFILDSGVTGYSIISVFDSTLLDKMLGHKVKIAEKFGKDYPTIRFQIHGLHIDTMLANVRTIKDISEKDRVKPRNGTNIIKVNLGMNFLKRYDNILIDRNKKVVHFVLN